MSRQTVSAGKVDMVRDSFNICFYYYLHIVLLNRLLMNMVMNNLDSSFALLNKASEATTSGGISDLSLSFKMYLPVNTT